MIENKDSKVRWICDECGASMDTENHWEDCSHHTKNKLSCVDCGKRLSPIDWKKTGLTPTREVRCNECGMKQFG